MVVEKVEEKREKEEGMVEGGYEGVMVEGGV